MKIPKPFALSRIPKRALLSRGYVQGFFFIGKMVRSNTVLFIVITIVLVDLGAYAGYRIGSAMSSKVSDVEARNERVTTVDAVFEQVQAQGTLVCASKSYDLYSKVESSNCDLLNLFDVPFTKNKYWMRYVGTIQAGVNLKTAKFTSQNKDKKSGLLKSVVVELDALNSGLIDQAKVFAQQNIQTMLRGAMGSDVKVTINWRS